MARKKHASPKKASSDKAADKTTATGTKPSKPRSFNGLIRGHSMDVRTIAMALRDVVLEAAPDAQESFYGGGRPMAMYRTTGDLCWIQPLKQRCNLYFMRGDELNDEQGFLEGSGKHLRHAKIKTLDQVQSLPVREWLDESLDLNRESVAGALSFDEVLMRMRKICLALPNTKETETWGKPHFRVGEKIFCGCGESQGSPRIGLKMEPRKSNMMMKLPGIEKAPYSRPNDGWVSIDPATFDDWGDIEEFLVESYCIIAPKRLSAKVERNLS